MSAEEVLTDSATDQGKAITEAPVGNGNGDGEYAADAGDDDVDAAATRRSIKTKQAPIAKMDEDDDAGGDDFDAAATGRSIKTKQAPIAKMDEDDETDIDPNIVIQQSIRELKELEISSTKRSYEKLRNLNNNVIPTPAAPPVPSNPKTSHTQSKYVYNMHHTHRDKAVIINNINFQPVTRMSKRGGSQRDAEHLIGTLDKLGFNVQAHTDLTIKKTRAVLQSISRQNHENSDCLLFVIMSHGEKDVLFCTDGTIPVDDVTAPFKGDRCPSLAGKPKIFFIQACRGQQLDGGVGIDGGEEETDGVAIPYERRQLIPAEADFLVGYSSPPGYYSWRNQGIGAWFIQAILSVLNQHGTELEIQQMMTRVNHIVAYEYMSNCSIPGFDQKKQVPCIVSTLTKELYFKPKTTDL